MPIKELALDINVKAGIAPMVINSEVALHALRGPQQPSHSPPLEMGIPYT